MSLTNQKTDDVSEALENWRLVREKIFAYERAPPEIWNELAEAEHRLMQVARARKPTG